MYTDDLVRFAAMNLWIQDTTKGVDEILEKAEKFVDELTKKKPIVEIGDYVIFDKKKTDKSRH